MKNIKLANNVEIDMNDHYKDRLTYLEELVRKYKFDYLTGLMGKRDFMDKSNILFEEFRFANIKKAKTARQAFKAGLWSHEQIKELKKLFNHKTLNKDFDSMAPLYFGKKYLLNT